MVSDRKSTGNTGYLHSLLARECYAIIQYMLLTVLHIPNVIAWIRKVASELHALKNEI